jgi:spermidine synthase
VRVRLLSAAHRLVPRRQILDRTTTPDGAPLVLSVEGGHHVVRVGRLALMSSQLHGSEEAMAAIACEPLRERAHARVLVGGLGMGFTLRACLDALGADASVTVVELFPAVVGWNLGPLAPLAGRPLEDPRVALVTRDLVEYLGAVPHRFDAILVDVDNGPEAFTTDGNGWLYSPAGLGALRGALCPAGTLVVWSAFRSAAFAGRLRAAGLAAEEVSVRARGTTRKGARHTLYVGRARGTSEAPPTPSRRRRGV